VTFNPPLESALRTNVEGTKNVIAFAKRMRRPALIHTSTCFVAGNRSGAVWEDEELDGYFPRHKELSGTVFSVEQEMIDNAQGAARIRQLADDAQVLAELRQQARQRLEEENRDPDDEPALKLAVARARKEWIRAEMTKQGMERAAAWGWPNIYTYTKSMGDQLVARETGIVRAIVRPAIVESAEAFPFRGWNEGFTTSAPLVYLALKGQNVLPVSPKLILDVVPVDHVQDQLGRRAWSSGRSPRILTTAFRSPPSGGRPRRRRGRSGACARAGGPGGSPRSSTASRRGSTRSTA